MHTYIQCNVTALTTLRLENVSTESLKNCPDVFFISDKPTNSFQSPGMNMAATANQRPTTFEQFTRMENELNNISQQQRPPWQQQR